MEPIYWQELEYTPKEKNTDFYWAVGIIAVALSLTAAMYGNPILGVLILMSAVVIVLISMRKPRTVAHIIDDRGITIGDDFFSYKDIDAFHFDKKYFHHLVVKTRNNFLGIKTMNIPEEVDVEYLHDYFLSVMPDKEKEMIETPYHLIFERLGI